MLVPLQRLALRVLGLSFWGCGFVGSQMPHVCGRRHRQSIRAGTCALSNAVYSLSVHGGAGVRGTRDARPQAELACGAGAEAGWPAPPSLPFSGCGVLFSLPSLLPPSASFRPSLLRCPALVGPVAPFSGLPLEWPFSLPLPRYLLLWLFLGTSFGREERPSSKSGRLWTICGDGQEAASVLQLGLVRVCGPCLAAPFPSAAPAGHVPGPCEVLPYGRRGAARHGQPAPGGGVGGGSAALPSRRGAVSPSPHSAVGCMHSC